MHSTEVNSSNVPAFLIKLWKLVEDSACNDLIAWSENGLSFIIKDQARFASELLPQYFKHNNMASFVRQLNMYGFRKVINYERSGLRGDNNEMEFQHSFFIKEQMELLELIKRKIPNTKTVSEPRVKSNASNILTDLTSIMDKQEIMDNMLVKMKQENEILWKEITSMRQKHKQQEQVIQKVVQFLVQVIRQPVGLPRKVPMMLHGSPNYKGNSSKITTVDLLKKANECIVIPDKNSPSSSPVIHEVEDFEVEEPLSVGSTGKPSSSMHSKSPERVVFNKKTTPNIVVASPAANSSEGIKIVYPASPLECVNLNSSVKTLAVPDDYAETILSLPVEYITASDLLSSYDGTPSNNVVIPGKSNVRNVISLSKKKDTPKVIRIPEETDIYDVISPPGSSNVFPKENVVNVITIPEGTGLSNVISIAEGSDISNFINDLNKQNKDTPNTETDKPSEQARNSASVSNIYDTEVCLSDLKAESLNTTKSPLSVSLAKYDYDDSLVSDSLNTPKVYLVEGLEESPFRLVDCKPKTPMSIAEQEHDYPAPLVADNLTKTATAENTFSNHLLIVEEELNRLQDNIATTSWDYDADKLLGLFSSDGMVSNESMVDHFTDGISIKKEPEDDILENDLMIPLTPQILDIPDLQSPFLRQLLSTDNPDGELPGKTPVLVEQELEETTNPDGRLEETECPTGDTTSSSKRRKNSKSTKGKCRKLK